MWPGRWSVEALFLSFPLRLVYYAFVCVVLLSSIWVHRNMCVLQVCLGLHMCVLPTAVHGLQSNLPLWSPWLLEASAPPHLFSNSPLWPRVRVQQLSDLSGAAPESWDPIALGFKGHVAVPELEPPTCYVNTPVLSCLLTHWALMKPVLNPQTSGPRFCPKEARPRSPCVVWSS